MIATSDWARRALGRPESEGARLLRTGSLSAGLPRTLITGGEGSIGRAVAECVPGAEAADLDALDVRDSYMVMTQFLLIRPSLVIHMAGAKHATTGEESPYDAVRTNVVGTANVLEWAQRFRARVVVASTCKACDPETAYGATKLIAERMALNMGQSVVRFYNVVDTSSNVFERWARIPIHEPLQVTPCKRRFMTRAEAVALTLLAARGTPGRYVLTDTLERRMEDVARDLYPGRKLERITPRRGDRLIEPWAASCERMRKIEGSEWASMAWSPHDPPETKGAAWASDSP